MMSIESLGIASVAAVTVICYVLGMACKAFEGVPDKFIPVICGIAGGLLGVVGFVTHMPEFPANDILTAIAVGCVSGLAATGINQIGKQLSA